MQFHRSAIHATLALTIIVGVQSSTQATTKYDSILKQPRLPADSPDIARQPETKAATTSINQARQTFFDHSPMLTRAVSSQNGANLPSTYKFTLTVPPDAGQSLKSVTITQAKNAETIKFDLRNSRAYIGRQLTPNSEVPLISMSGGQPANSGETAIAFAQPALPGNTVTIALAVQKNPVGRGVYLFGVTAYPEGENGLGQFLGYGRIDFDGSSN
jgi:hypothetical protein